MTEPTDATTPKDGASVPGGERKAHLALAVVSLVLLAVAGAIGLWRTDASAAALALSQHGPALIGTPAAILLATALVSGARAIDGEFGMSLLGVELKGGAALLAAWLVVFTAIVLAIRALW